MGKILWRRDRLPTPVFWPGVPGVTKNRTRLNDFHTFFLGAADTAVHTKTRSQGIHILLEGKNVKRKQTFKINSE